jgi:exopolysaccharide biosynthesis predicted pyruvyltransferase EpsI
MTIHPAAGMHCPSVSKVILKCVSRRISSVIHRQIKPADFSTSVIKSRFQDLDACVQQFKNQTVILVPNTGNAGDGLLAYSARQFLKNAGVGFRITEDVRQVTADDVVLLSPGGSLIKEYQCYYEELCRAFIQTDAREVILLPHTIRYLSHPSSFDSPRLTIFCRDRTSYAYCKSQLKKAKVLLSPDLALAGLLLPSPPSVQPFFRVFTQMNLRQRIKLLRFIVYSMLVAKTNITLYRTDIEATIQTSSKTNLDLAGTYISKFLIDGEAELITFFLFKALRQRAYIHTNRLHTVISGLLCNKDVNYCDNSYGKIEAVFEVAGVSTSA